MHTASVIIYKNGLSDKKFTNLFCKEFLMTISMVAYLPKNFYFKKVVNEQILLFHNAGLVEYWDKKSGAKISVLVKETHAAQDPIHVKDLKGIFYAYLVACGFSSLCFIAEVFIKLVRWRKKRFQSTLIPYTN